MTDQTGPEQIMGVSNTITKFLCEGLSEFVFIDRLVRQTERFFLVGAPLVRVSPEMQKVHEREDILEMRWWSLNELEATPGPSQVRGGMASYINEGDKIRGKTTPSLGSWT